MHISELQPNDIAPCGVNCLACSARFNIKTPCPGCRAPEEMITRKSCRNCVKKACAFEKGFTWCFECPQFPCTKIKQFSARYEKNYHVNLIANGLDAKEDMDSFVEAQIERFTCRYCGATMDQHNRRCSICATEDPR